MSHQEHRSCIEACVRCAQECEHCANACLSEKDEKNGRVHPLGPGLRGDLLDCGCLYEP